MWGSTVVFPDPPSGSPHMTVTSAPSGTSRSTVASESPRFSFAVTPVNSDRPMFRPSASSTASKLLDP